MIEWAVIGAAAAAVGAGGYLYRVSRRGQIHRRWSGILDAVAKRIGGRPSTGSRFDAPELRAEYEGTTVTLRILGTEGDARNGRVLAIAALPDNANTVRFYFGWDVLEVPVAVEHLNDVPYPPVQRVEGDVKIRADDAALASRFMARAIVELIDVRREADAHAVEVITKGGYLELVLHGLWDQPTMLERVVQVSARLATIVDEISRGTQIEAPVTPEKAPIIGPCTVCEKPKSDADDEADWTACSGCNAAYHRSCFTRATMCLVCGHT